MRNELVIRKIDNMASTYGRKLLAGALENYLDALEDLNPHDIMSACSIWMKSENKMPTPAELRKKTQGLQKWIAEKNGPSSFDLKCQYFNPSESEISRSLCAGHAEKEEAFHSKMQFGKVFCNWHYACAYAKAFPESTTAMFVKGHLKNERSRLGKANDAVKFDKQTGEILRSASSLAQGWGLERKVQEGGLNRV